MDKNAFKSNSTSEHGRSGVEITKKELSFIEANDFEEWTFEHVIDWVKRCSFDEEILPEIVKVIKRRKIEGSSLKACTFIDVKELFPFLERNEVKYFWVLVGNLKEKKKFNKKWTVCCSKIFKLNEAMKDPQKEAKNCATLCRKLANLFADKERFYENYFEFFSEFLRCKRVENECRQFKKEGKKKKVKAAQRKLDRYKETTVDLFKVLLEKENAEIREMEYFGRMSEILKRREIRIPVRIVLCEQFLEVSKGEIDNRYKYAVSPVPYVCEFSKMKFGVLTTAVQIGPWWLSWGRSELVIPKKAIFSYRGTLIDSHRTGPFCLFSGNLSGKGKVNVGGGCIAIRSPSDLFGKICDVCYHWNTTMKFGVRKGKNRGNSHHFVEYLLKNIGIPNEIMEPLINCEGKTSGYGILVEKTFAQVKREGRVVGMVLPLSCEMQKKCKTNEEEVIFESHRQLDEFVNSFLYHHNLFAAELNLLRFFDRIFWLRHLSNPRDERFIPRLENNGDPNCPFQDPRIT